MLSVPGHNDPPNSRPACLFRLQAQRRKSTARSGERRSDAASLACRWTKQNNIHLIAGATAKRGAVYAHSCASHFWWGEKRAIRCNAVHSPYSLHSTQIELPCPTLHAVLQLPPNSWRAARAENWHLKASELRPGPWLPIFQKHPPTH